MLNTILNGMMGDLKNKSVVRITECNKRKTKGSVLSVWFCLKKKKKKYNFWRQQEDPCTEISNNRILHMQHMKTCRSNMISEAKEQRRPAAYAKL